MRTQKEGNHAPPMDRLIGYRAMTDTYLKLRSSRANSLNAARAVKVFVTLDK